MGKDTFYNLKDDKKEKILEVLKHVFAQKPFHKVTVKEIVDELGIARGSFYQYFEDLEDAYFEIINRELVDIHGLFAKLINENKGNLETTLMDFGNSLEEVLFVENTYSIYKYIYLYWDETLSQRWKKAHSSQVRILSDNSNDMDSEKMHYIKGVIHMIIKRNFQENWDKKEFRKKYEKQIYWLIKGVN
ncbi:MAG: TetR/AcrR family transcriptional regulator [Tissierellia bacterium]|nr:TetR/AcrR family transcriptional regulator [Tissierellia bacterium]